jgi:hypothetical protein
MLMVDSGRPFQLEFASPGRELDPEADESMLSVIEEVELTESSFLVGRLKRDGWRFVGVGGAECGRRLEVIGMGEACDR